MILFILKNLTWFYVIVLTLDLFFFIKSILKSCRAIKYIRNLDVAFEKLNPVYFEHIFDP